MATVRETLTSEYGENWERQLSHVVYVAQDLRSTHRPFPHRTEYVPVIVFNRTRVRDAYDYVDPADVANYRVLSEWWEDVEGLTAGPYSCSTHIALDLDSEAPENLVEVIEALEDYPVLDDDEFSRAEQEMIEDHWEYYGKMDTLDAIARAIGQDSRLDLSDAAADIAWTLTSSGVLDYGDNDGYPTVIDVSACDFGTEAVARFVSEHYGTVVMVKTDSGYGPEIELDLRETNLLNL